MKEDTTLKAIGAVAVLAAIGAGIWGYVLNVIHFAHHINEPLVMSEVARGIGLIIPLVGSVLGFTL